MRDIGIRAEALNLEGLLAVLFPCVFACCSIGEGS
jgi:hypothetical protein